MTQPYKKRQRTMPTQGKKRGHWGGMRHEVRNTGSTAVSSKARQSSGTTATYDYRVILHTDGSTRSVKFPMESCSTTAVMSVPHSGRKCCYVEVLLVLLSRRTGEGGGRDGG